MTGSPYRSTPVFDETTLPAALRANHSTKAGVWGVIRIIEGQVRLTYVAPPREIILDPDHPGLVEPEQVHFVTPLGVLKMQVEFHDRPPLG
jgi:tellurite resistance-related uncharacterized protein